MDTFDDELAIAELADAMRVRFGPRARGIAENQAGAAASAQTRRVWHRIALKLRRWDAIECGEPDIGSAA
ncbi:MAG TPA: hypothetical protein VGC28_07385 [Sphingomonas sp.]